MSRRLKAVPDAGPPAPPIACGHAPHLLPDPKHPVSVAEKLMEPCFTHKASGLPVVRYWKADWWQWQGARWQKLDESDMRADLAVLLKDAIYIDGKGQEKAWAPTPDKLSRLLRPGGGLQAVTNVRSYTDQPAWLDGREHEGVIVACHNGLLDIASRKLSPLTPAYLNVTAVPFAYDPKATAPAWQAFLDDLWPDDPEQQTLLGEWFGYVISGRTDLQKMGLMVGPKRAGKGTITRVLKGLVGPQSYAGLTAQVMSGPFGLESLIGKALAVMPDVRLDTSRARALVERLLSISGEDDLPVNRKYQQHWSGRLPCRVMVLTNETPALEDPSGAIVSRFLMFRLTRSWYGVENTALEADLHRELPGILNWALDGLGRLEAQGRFSGSATAERMHAEVTDLVSPMLAWVRDCCVIDPDAVTSKDEVYAAWVAHEKTEGRRPVAKNHFVAKLRAAVPSMGETQATPDRKRAFTGIRLRVEE